MLILNPNTRIIENTNNLMLLRVQDELIKLSSIEFDIILSFAQSNNFYTVINSFSDLIKIKEEQLGLLISKSVQNNLLIEESQTIKNKSINFLGASIRYSFKRNNKIFELFNLDLTTTVFNKIFSHTRIVNSILIFLFSFALFVIGDLLLSPLNFRENYFSTLYKIPYNFSSLLGLIYFSSFCSIIFHELGHYLLYKSVKGKTSIFGFGLMFYVLPVFYTKMYTNFIKTRKHKVLIDSGGFIFDVLLVLFILYFTKHFHNEYPTLSFFGYTLITSITIRSFFNINVFLPGTDGFHILSDSLNDSNLFKTSVTKSKLIISRKEKLSIRNIGYVFYLAFSYISMGLSWSMFFLPIIFYFYYTYN